MPYLILHVELYIISWKCSLVVSCIEDQKMGCSLIGSPVKVTLVWLQSHYFLRWTVGQNSTHGPPLKWCQEKWPHKFELVVILCHVAKTCEKFMEFYVIFLGKLKTSATFLVMLSWWYPSCFLSMLAPAIWMWLLCMLVHLLMCDPLLFAFVHVTDSLVSLLNFCPQLLFWH